MDGRGIALVCYEMTDHNTWAWHERSFEIGDFQFKCSSVIKHSGTQLDTMAHLRRILDLQDSDEERNDTPSPKCLSPSPSHLSGKVYTKHQARIATLLISRSHLRPCPGLQTPQGLLGLAQTRPQCHDPRPQCHNPSHPESTHKAPNLPTGKRLTTQRAGPCANTSQKVVFFRPAEDVALTFNETNNAWSISPEHPTPEAM